MKRIVCTLMLTALMGCMKSVAVEENTLDGTFHLQRVGVSARELLTDEKYKALKIEIQYMPGYAPDEAAVASLKDFLFAYLHKPEGITIITQEIEAVPDTVLSLDKIAEIEKANRTAFTSRDEIAVYILYTDGYFTESNMLGWAYRNTSAVLFGRNLRENSDAPGKHGRTSLETRVLRHELGHLLGLVNVGTPMQSEHKDNAHGKHCTNKDCLMYYLTETEEPPGLLFKKDQPLLDEACEADLRANGGR